MLLGGCGLFCRGGEGNVGWGDGDGRWLILGGAGYLVVFKHIYWRWGSGMKWTYVLTIWSEYHLDEVFLVNVVLPTAWISWRRGVPPLDMVRVVAIVR